MRGDWHDTAPPATGWEAARTPDDWTRRWPGHDGVVWYRLRWDIEGAPQTQGLYIPFVMQAAVITVNGVELQRDDHLVEPLSRSWNRPRFVLLPAPVLHTGRNELLIRVSGYHLYQPALGPVTIGPPGPQHAAWRDAWLTRQSLNWLSLGICATLGAFFIALWLMRRRETAYGWYGAQQAARFVFTANFVATSPWPFTHSDTWAAVVSIAYVLFHGCNAMFVLRFMGQRWPRREAVLWLLIGLLCAATLLAPHEQLRTMRNVMAWASSALLLAIAGVFVTLAWWRGGTLPQRLLSLTALASAAAMVNDLLVFTRIVDSNFYLAPYTDALSTVGIALTLAWTFVTNTRRIESFADELQHSVAAARADLAASLAHQHALALLHARLGERVNLAHDLHDGLGSMLIGHINTLERRHQPVQPTEVLDMLRGMRDDLRLIIDTAAAQQYGELMLADLLAPLRHRCSRLFELHGIDVHWQVAHIDRLHLSTTQSLDVLRILQEALTNVLKHSQATRVDVALVREDSHLVLSVRDNGIGLSDPSTRGSPGATGLHSMQARAQRLKAELRIHSSGRATEVRLRMPWPEPAASTDAGA
ncbi:sensor histidine kinase [Comamonas serinivorans]|uniref:sensor histidine kinase n=1 Tax=Comamonas serinivorans TaxID=1082851 RepID=UPI001F33BE8E|nr:ATP-binding protein [Comamonas serinivorans]